MVVNRLTGAVTVKVVGLGLWRSIDKGTTWRRIDQGAIGGRDETGWATSVDQNAPERMASFSLDGPAGWTPDGIHWKSFTPLGRNWDFGSVDWAPAQPRTVIAAKHETDPPGEVYGSTDGGITWRLLKIHLSEKRDQLSMVGAAGEATFIYSNGEGIHRSTDAGETWSKVSPANPQTRIPVLFGGVLYLGTASGLLVSTDQGASWKEQVAAVDVWQGPFFGNDEKEIVVIGKDGIFTSKNAGESWSRIAELKPKEENQDGFLFTPNWFGCYAWDPIKRTLYTSSMGNSVFRIEWDSGE